MLRTDGPTADDPTTQPNNCINGDSSGCIEQVLLSHTHKQQRLRRVATSQSEDGLKSEDSVVESEDSLKSSMQPNMRA